MTAPTAPTVLELHRDIAIQGQRVEELIKAMFKNALAMASVAEQRTVGLALVGSAMTLASYFTNPDMLTSLREVPDTEADLTRMLTSVREIGAAVIRELTVLFPRFGWDLP